MSRHAGARLVAGAARCAAATLLMWRVLDHRVLLAGTAVGVLGGVLIGGAAAARRVPWPARLAAVGAVAWMAAVLTAGSWRGPLRIPSVMATFLTVGLPAAGLRGLALVAAAVALPATAITAWGALRHRSGPFVGGPAAAVLGASVLAAPRPAPLLAVGAVCALVATTIFLDAHRGDEQLPPLIPDPAVAGRRRSPFGAALIGVGAVGAAVAASTMPALSSFDLRHFVHPDLLDLADENPLARAARLQTDQPSADAAPAAIVAVRGGSPGRLRLAVLDTYQPEGWHQVTQYAITGRALADGVFPAGAASATHVEVSRGPGSTGLAGVPTAGLPQRVGAPDDVVYSAAAGVLLTRGSAAPVAYDTAPLEASAAGVERADQLSTGVPSVLRSCPDSTIVRNAAQALAAGTPDPLERLRRIESWLKLRKVYDPGAPGGQTLGSLEQFVGQDLARGNMEAFVSTFAVLARCADVPVRVVVGFPAPAADTTTTYRPEQITAWVEVPMAAARWVPIDPVPTPDEQRRQAEVAQQPPPPPSPAPDPAPAADATPVDPVHPGDHAAPWRWVAAGAALAAVGLLAWLVMVPWATRRRRQRTADPAAAVLAAWDHVVDRLADRSVPLRAHLTPAETAAATAGRIPRAATALLGRAATLADQARYDPAGTIGADAGLAWALADAVDARLPRSWPATLAPLRHPLVAARRLAGARRHQPGARPWEGTLTADELVDSPAVSAQIPGIQLEHVLGEGASAVVYRGHVLDDGRPVAAKVFRYTVEHRPFDRQRFEWEARVAAMVSGQHNLPELFASGLTAAGQPYLVTRLYGRGTLTSRIQRGGPLSPGEVVALGQSLALALDTLHRHSILHGDVKPENVFIDDDGTPILGDLGSAWVRAEGGPAASMTPPYAAPEIWLGRHPSKMSDLYSLGLTLLFATTGRPPIAGAPPQADEVVAAFGTDRYLALLELDPRRRPRTARDAARLLGADVDDPSLAWRTAVVLPTPTLVRTPLDQGG